MWGYCGYDFFRFHTNVVRSLYQTDTWTERAEHRSMHRMSVDWH
jgi:hypothetical protein